MKLGLIVISLLVFVFLISNVQAELYHDQRPEYADNDFIKPTEMIKLEQLALFQIIVIGSMLVITTSSSTFVPS